MSTAVSSATAERQSSNWISKNTCPPMSPENLLDYVYEDDLTERSVRYTPCNAISHTSAFMALVPGRGAGDLKASQRPAVVPFVMCRQAKGLTFVSTLDTNAEGPCGCNPHSWQCKTYAGLLYNQHTGCMDTLPQPLTTVLTCACAKDHNYSRHCAGS